ncbi:MAG: hypothetical protein AAB512_02780 [Patescibacteria group bacterium]
MTKEQEQIFSSTGEAGLKRRGFDRLYWNWKGAPIDNPDILSRAYGRLRNLGSLAGISRVVFRSLVTNDVFQKMPAEVASEIEVIVPFGNDWIILAAHNGVSRKPIVPVAQMVKETSSYVNKPRRAFERVRLLEDLGVSFNSTFTAEQEAQLLNLWSRTFGWSGEEITALRRRLNGDIERGIGRSLWFSSATKDGVIVAAAMAEKLRLRTSSGYVDLIENTEWKTLEGYENQGFITATIAHLNSQVIRDLRGKEFLIFAECNFMSRSDRAANGAGFVVPERRYDQNSFPQILCQNVEVNDGIDPKGLRDFTFMHLPPENIEKYYSRPDTKEVLR